MDSLAANFYRALGDEQRLRILNLLHAGPLCVCFLQEILAEGQVKMSKQLAVLKKADLVTVTKEGTWRVYRLGEPVSPLLEANLHAWREEPTLRDRLAADRAARARILSSLRNQGERAPSGVVASCCAPGGEDREVGAAATPADSTFDFDPDPELDPELDPDLDSDSDPGAEGPVVAAIDPWNDFPL